jgi:hypothetical protein
VLPGETGLSGQLLTVAPAVNDVDRECDLWINNSQWRYLGGLGKRSLVIDQLLWAILMMNLRGLKWGVYE